MMKFQSTANTFPQAVFLSLVFMVCHHYSVMFMKVASNEIWQSMAIRRLDVYNDFIIRQLVRQHHITGYQQGVFMASETRIRLEAGELAWLCEQLALIQRSGILMPEGIELLAESTETSRLKTVLDQLHQQIKKMIPLSDAMKAVGARPDYLVRMIRIGEVSGNLDQILSSL